MLEDRAVIVNADDFGLTRGVNEAVLRAHRHGIVTSTSIMVTGRAIGQAAAMLKSDGHDLGVGIHLDLTCGPPIERPENLPLLCRGTSTFALDFPELLFYALGSRRHELLTEIRREWTAQFEKLLALGIRPDHVNSHRHVHIIPGLFELAESLGEQYGCVAIRTVTNVPWRSVHHALTGHPAGCLMNWPKYAVLRLVGPRVRPRRLMTPDSLVGVLESGHMTEPMLRDTLATPRVGVTEIVVHPGTGRDSHDLPLRDRAFLASEARRSELHALCSPSIVRLARRAGVKLTSYREIAAQHNCCSSKELPARGAAKTSSLGRRSLAE